MDKIKNIINHHLHWGTSKENAITNILFEIAEGEDKELLIELGNYSEELKSKAEKLYNKYKAEYYKNN